MSRTSPGQAHLLPLLYGLGAEAGWTGGMAAITLALLGSAQLPPQPQVLDAGCGGGAMLRTLAGAGWAHAVGLDLHPAALFGDAHGAAPVTGGDLQRLPFGDGCFDAFLALDSFDQQGVSLPAALGEARRVLRSGGLLVVRVSAYPWLHGAHDVAFGTGRRYTRGELLDAVHGAGFIPVRVTYANSLLAPPVVGMRLVQRDDLHPQTENLYGSAAAHRILETALRLEARWLARRDLPFGLSLFVLAVRPDNE